jgi:hypothetical protein
LCFGIFRYLIVLFRNINSIFIHHYLVSFDGPVECGIQEPVILLFEASVGASVETQFPSLAEWFRAAVHPTDKGLLVCVSILVFTEVLWKCKNFATKLAREGLLAAVNVVVPLKWEFRGESLSATRMLTNEDSHYIIWRRSLLMRIMRLILIWGRKFIMIIFEGLSRIYDQVFLLLLICFVTGVDSLQLINRCLNGVVNLLIDLSLLLKVLALHSKKIIKF